MKPYQIRERYDAVCSNLAVIYEQPNIVDWEIIEELENEGRELREKMLDHIYREATLDYDD